MSNPPWVENPIGDALAPSPYREAMDECERLRHDIERHIAIATAEANECERLRALLREARDRIIALHGCYPPDHQPQSSAGRSNAMLRRIEAALQAERAPDARGCTCHPDDNPPRPCPRQYALSECRAAAAQDAPAEPRPRKAKSKVLMCCGEPMDGPGGFGEDDVWACGRCGARVYL